MNRTELPKLLFNKMNEVKPYPKKVAPVEEMLTTTAFFPGGQGLWLAEESEDFPEILILGQDFSTIDVFEKMKREEYDDLSTPTWKNMRKLFEEVGIDLTKCYFSNVFMGLRESDKMTGEFPGNRDQEFVNRNRDFLRYQIHTIKPRIIITLGKFAAEMLAKTSDGGMDHWKGYVALNTAHIGLTVNARFDQHSCLCVALEHPSMRNSNVKRRRYKNYEGHFAEEEMLRDAISIA